MSIFSPSISFSSHVSTFSGMSGSCLPSTSTEIARPPRARHWVEMLSRPEKRDTRSRSWSGAGRVPLEPRCFSSTSLSSIPATSISSLAALRLVDALVPCAAARRSRARAASSFCCFSSIAATRSATAAFSLASLLRPLLRGGAGPASSSIGTSGGMPLVSNSAVAVSSSSAEFSLGSNPPHGAGAGISSLSRPVSCPPCRTRWGSEG